MKELLIFFVVVVVAAAAAILGTISFMIYFKTFRSNYSMIIPFTNCVKRKCLSKMICGTFNGVKYIRNKI